MSFVRYTNSNTMLLCVLYMYKREWPSIVVNNDYYGGVFVVLVVLTIDNLLTAKKCSCVKFLVLTPIDAHFPRDCDSLIVLGHACCCKALSDSRGTHVSSHHMFAFIFSIFRSFCNYSIVCSIVHASTAFKHQR